MIISTNRVYLSLAFLFVGFGLCFSQNVVAAKGNKVLKEITKGEHRSQEHIDRNKYRHPVETLSFFGLEADMTVVEIWPGKGWYTEIIAPLVSEYGTFYAAGFSQDENAPQWRKNMNQAFKDKIASHAGLYGQVNITELSESKFDIAPEQSADTVLTFRNVHNWMKGGYAQEVFDAMYKALKPGGVLGVVEHRAKPGTSLQKQIQSGYVTVEYVKMLAEKSGFEFVASSEINANPKDSADHPRGVWTLPPTLRLGETDREKYLAIGESDRMTLKFKRPLASK